MTTRSYRAPLFLGRRSPTFLFHYSLKEKTSKQELFLTNLILTGENVFWLKIVWGMIGACRISGGQMLSSDQTVPIIALCHCYGRFVWRISFCWCLFSTPFSRMLSFQSNFVVLAAEELKLWSINVWMLPPAPYSGISQPITKIITVVSVVPEPQWGVAMPSQASYCVFALAILPYCTDRNQ